MQQVKEKSQDALISKDLMTKLTHKKEEVQEVEVGEHGPERI